MEAIRALQAKLKEAQKVSNVKKISERNCIDLVQKLIQLENVQLFHTVTGKEWLTPEHLDREICDALAASGGRLNVTELPNEVGVAIEHCEHRAELMRKADSSLYRLHGELISRQYLQSVAQEIEESLGEVGCLAVSDLATRFSLPAEFIRDSVIVLLDSNTLNVKQNTIYTGAHAARVEARVRGALRGCTQPIPMQQFSARHSLDADMCVIAVQKLLKDGTVQGKMQGSTFTPKAHSENQAGKIDSFFESNQFMPLSLAKSAGVDVKDWAKTNKIKGVTLKTVFVAEQLVETVLGSISDAVSSDNWVDVQPLLPPSLLVDDARELVQHLVSKKRLPAAAVPIDRVIMSRKFIERIASNFEAEVSAAAEKMALSRSAGASKAAKKVMSAPAADPEDEFSTKKKDKKKGARGKKGKADDEDEDDGGGGGGGGGGGESGVDNQTVQDVLADKFAELPAEVYDDLCDQVQPLLLARVTEKVTTLASTLQSKQKAQFEKTEKFVQDRYETIVLAFRALSSARLQESPLYQHLLREVMAEPLHQMLAMRLEEATGTSTEVTAANRKQCLDKLVAKQGAASVASLSKLLDIFSKGKDSKDAKEAKEPKDEKKSAKGKKKSKDVDSDDAGDAEEADITDVFHTAAADCHIFCRKVDKKREKAALQEHRAERREKLKDVVASDSLQIFWLGLQLCFIQDGVVGLLFPQEAWAVPLLAPRLADEAIRDEAVALYESIEKNDDPVALESAVAKWRDRALGGK